MSGALLKPLRSTTRHLIASGAGDPLVVTCGTNARAKCSHAVVDAEFGVPSPALHCEYHSRHTARQLCPGAGPHLGSNRWWTGFKARHPDLVRRATELMDNLRASGANLSTVTSFFTLLDKVCLESGIRGIYNMDEVCERQCWFG